MKIKTKVDIYYNKEEDLEFGDYEIVNLVQKNPYGNWNKCKEATLEIEVEDE